MHAGPPRIDRCGLARRHPLFVELLTLATCSNQVWNGIVWPIDNFRDTCDGLAGTE
jgi:hypothetical protein